MPHVSPKFRICAVVIKNIKTRQCIKYIMRCLSLVSLVSFFIISGAAAAPKNPVWGWLKNTSRIFPQLPKKIEIENFMRNYTENTLEKYIFSEIILCTIL
jgi:hypothetical protein